MEIEIKKIFVKDNIRTRIDESDVSDLMKDIQQKGLLQSVGVSKNGDMYELLYGNRRLTACKKLGHTLIDAKVFDDDLTKIQRIAINASENVHREDVSPYEFARAVNNLMKEGLNKMECSVALSVSLSRVDTALRIFNRVPEVEGITTGYVPAGSINKGIVATSTVDAIANLRQSPAKSKILLQAAHDGNLGVLDVRLIGQLINNGMDLVEAIKEKENYMAKTVTLIVRKDEYLVSGINIFSKHVKDIMQGIITPVKNLVY